MHAPGPCQYCRENHEPRPLSFDGFGINSCGIYRDRLATFTTGQDDTTRKTLAALWIAAPDLLEALKDLYYFADGIRQEWESNNPNGVYNPLRIKHLMAAKQAIAKAEGRS